MSASRVPLAGLSGHLSPAFLQSDDLALRSAVARSAAGVDLGTALGREALDVPVYATIEEALDGVDVLIDYTSHLTVKAHPRGDRARRRRRAVRSTMASCCSRSTFGAVR